MNLELLKYPIGKFEKPETVTKELLSQWIAEIAAFPAQLKNEVSQLSDEQLDSRYRPDG